MPFGYVYDCPNKYILNKLLKQIKALKINYSIYDEYVVVERKLKGNFSRTVLLTKTINTLEKEKEYQPALVKIRKWKNNEVIYEQEKIKSLIRDRFRLTCDRHYFYLNTGIKRYKFKRTNEIFEEYFRKQKKAYFEKKWEESPIDEDMPDVGIKTIDKLYSFNFDSFYNNIYKQLTENQQIIIAFFMLNIMEIHQAKMMKVSQPYISLEIKRIAEKIRKRMSIETTILDVE